MDSSSSVRTVLAAPRAASLPVAHPSPPKTGTAKTFAANPGAHGRVANASTATAHQRAPRLRSLHVVPVQAPVSGVFSPPPSSHSSRSGPRKPPSMRSFRVDAAGASPVARRLLTQSATTSPVGDAQPKRPRRPRSGRVGLSPSARLDLAAAPRTSVVSAGDAVSPHGAVVPLLPRVASVHTKAATQVGGARAWASLGTVGNGSGGVAAGVPSENSLVPSTTATAGKNDATRVAVDAATGQVTAYPTPPPAKSKPLFEKRASFGRSFVQRLGQVRQRSFRALRQLASLPSMSSRNVTAVPAPSGRGESGNHLHTNSMPDIEGTIQQLVMGRRVASESDTSDVLLRAVQQADHDSVAAAKGKPAPRVRSLDPHIFAELSAPDADDTEVQVQPTPHSEVSSIDDNGSGAAVLLTPHFFEESRSFSFRTTPSGAVAVDTPGERPVATAGPPSAASSTTSTAAPSGKIESSPASTTALSPAQSKYLLPEGLDVTLPSPGSRLRKSMAAMLRIWLARARHSLLYRSFQLNGSSEFDNEVADVALRAEASDAPNRSPPVSGASSVQRMLQYSPPPSLSRGVSAKFLDWQSQRSLPLDPVPDDDTDGSGEATSGRANGGGASSTGIGARHASPAASSTASAQASDQATPVRPPMLKMTSFRSFVSASNRSITNRSLCGSPFSYDKDMPTLMARGNEHGRFTPRSVHAPIMVAIEAYKAEDATELTLKAGDRVRVDEQDERGWWKGTLLPDGPSGWFPSSFVEALDGSIGSGSVRSNAASERSLGAESPLRDSARFRRAPSSRSLRVSLALKRGGSDRSVLSSSSRIRPVARRVSTSSAGGTRRGDPLKDTGDSTSWRRLVNHASKPRASATDSVADFAAGASATSPRQPGSQRHSFASSASPVNEAWQMPWAWIDHASCAAWQWHPDTQAWVRCVELDPVDGEATTGAGGELHDESMTSKFPAGSGVGGDASAEAMIVQLEDGHTAEHVADPAAQPTDDVAGLHGTFYFWADTSQEWVVFDGPDDSSSIAASSVSNASWQYYYNAAGSSVSDGTYANAEVGNGDVLGHEAGGQDTPAVSSADAEGPTLTHTGDGADAGSVWFDDMEWVPATVVAGDDGMELYGVDTDGTVEIAQAIAVAPAGEHVWVAVGVEDNDWWWVWWSNQGVHHSAWAYREALSLWYDFSAAGASGEALQATLGSPPELAPTPPSSERTKTGPRPSAVGLRSLRSRQSAHRLLAGAADTHDSEVMDSLNDSAGHVAPPPDSDSDSAGKGSPADEGTSADTERHAQRSASPALGARNSTNPFARHSLRPYRTPQWQLEAAGLGSKAKAGKGGGATGLTVKPPEDNSNANVSSNPFANRSSRPYSTPRWQLRAAGLAPDDTDQANSGSDPPTDAASAQGGSQQSTTGGRKFYPIVKPPASPQRSPSPTRSPKKRSRSNVFRGVAMLVGAVALRSTQRYRTQRLAVRPLDTLHEHSAAAKAEGEDADADSNSDADVGGTTPTAARAAAAAAAPPEANSAHVDGSGSSQQPSAVADAPVTDPATKPGASAKSSLTLGPLISPGRNDPASLASPATRASTNEQRSSGSPHGDDESKHQPSSNHVVPATELQRSLAVSVTLPFRLARAVAAYTAEDPSEISLKEWDVINVTDHDQFGWFRGSVIEQNGAKGKQGWFPASFVEPYSAVIGSVGSGSSRADAVSHTVGAATLAASLGHSSASSRSDSERSSVASQPTRTPASPRGRSPGLWSSQTMDAIRMAALSKNVAAVAARAAQAAMMRSPHYDAGLTPTRPTLSRQSSSSARNLRAQVLKRAAAVTVQIHSSQAARAASPASVASHSHGSGASLTHMLSSGGRTDTDGGDGHTPNSGTPTRSFRTMHSSGAASAASRGSSSSVSSSLSGTQREGRQLSPTANSSHSPASTITDTDALIRVLYPDVPDAPSPANAGAGAAGAGAGAGAALSGQAAVPTGLDAQDSFSTHGSGNLVWAVEKILASDRGLDVV